MAAILLLGQASSLIKLPCDKREAAFQDLKYIVPALLYLPRVCAISSEKSIKTVQWGEFFINPC